MEVTVIYAMLINCNEHAIKMQSTGVTVWVIKCTQEGRLLWCHVNKSAIN